MTPKIKTTHLSNGQPFTIPKDGWYYDECCDCSLVHLIKIERHDKHYVLYSWRDDFITRKGRRRKK